VCLYISKLHTTTIAPDNELVALESIMDSGVVTSSDQSALMLAMERLDESLVAQGRSPSVQRAYGGLLLSESLFSGQPPESTAGFAVLDGQKWYHADTLELNTQLRAAGQLRTEAVLHQLGETAETDHNLRGGALDSLISDLPEAERNSLLNSSLNLQRELQLYQQGDITKERLVESILSTYQALGAHGIRGIYRINDSGQIWLDGVPRPTFGPNDSPVQGSPGHFANLATQSHVSLSSVVADLTGAPVWRAAMVDVAHFNEFAGDNPVRINSLSDSLSPDSLEINPEDPTLAESLQNALLLSGASSESDLRQLANHHFVTASHLLTQNARGVTPNDLMAAHGLINAENLEAFGYQAFITVNEGGKTSYEVSQGPYGGLSPETYQFAQAWLNSSREQRLDQLGLDADKWNKAESFIGQGIAAEQAANAAEFGIDDFMVISAAVGISILVGGATSGFVAGLLPTGTSVAVSTAISGAAGAAASSFSSTLILTRDVDEALKSGALAAITRLNSAVVTSRMEC